MNKLKLSAMVDWGDRARKARVIRRINQAKLAEAVGIGRITLSRIERGLMKQPKAALVDAMADELQVSWRYLAGHIPIDEKEQVLTAEEINWIAKLREMAPTARHLLMEHLLTTLHAASAMQKYPHEF